MLAPPTGINELLGGLLGGSPFETEDTGLNCNSCGWTYTDFRSKGRLGCAEDYEVFENALTPLLKRIHGSTRHVGRVDP